MSSSAFRVTTVDPSVPRVPVRALEGSHHTIARHGTEREGHTVRVVCISDTHSRHHLIEDLPSGDILVHAGDFTGRGDIREVQAFNEWLDSVADKFTHMVVIAGNHDHAFEKDPPRARAALTSPKVIYLEDSACRVEGLTIYGAPWQPWFCNWAFNLDRGAPLRAKWERIPAGVDIVVTHGPPYGVGDRNRSGGYCGCVDLMAVLQARRPLLHVSGHIHEGYGTHQDAHNITYVNASTCNLAYRPRNPPVVIDIEL